ncbi:AP2 domain-containing protein [Klebsiella michiganensis]|uniref:AP2 domain-containing protein n=1 Tax=Klebsiella michiganensis TaxID=1134687 RepID=UPI0039C1D704
MLTLIKGKIEKISGQWKSLYECQCGVRKLLFDGNVNSGKTKSCGCLRKKMAREVLSKHGMTKTYTYGVWAGMKGRCLVKTHGSYQRYGGSGVTICDRWHSFENFLSDMGEAPDGTTLDRIDGGKGYSPENCRWATYQVQAINRTVSSCSSTGVKGVSFKAERNRFVARITIGGKTKFLGYFKLLSEAIMAREEAEKKYFAPLIVNQRRY